MDYSILIGVKRERFEVLAKKENEVTFSGKLGATGGALARESLAVERLEVRRSSLMTGLPQPPRASEGKRASNPRLSAPFGENVTGGSSSTQTSLYSESSIPVGTGVNSIAPLMNSTSGRERDNPIDSRDWRIYSEENYAVMNRDPDGGLKARVVEGPGTYYIGIIDILQEWNWQKKLEHYFKAYIGRSDAAGISAVEPNYYADRFWRRCVLDTFDGIPEEEIRDTTGLMSFGSRTIYGSEQDSGREEKYRDTTVLGSELSSSNGASYGDNNPTHYAQVIR
jgi:hypothetical protein